MFYVREPGCQGGAEVMAIRRNFEAAFHDVLQCFGYVWGGVGVSLTGLGPTRSFLWRRGIFNK